MNVFLLLLHGLSATLLIGAITHQAIAIWWPPRDASAGWWQALRGVHSARYTAATVGLFVSTALLGAWLYTPFRIVVRAEYLDAHAAWATGLFEVKEHAGAIGLALLPAYWRSWRDPSSGLAVRRTFTTCLAAFAWWNFVVGHIVNNTRGM